MTRMGVLACWVGVAAVAGCGIDDRELDQGSGGGGAASVGSGGEGGSFGGSSGSGGRGPSELGAVGDGLDTSCKPDGGGCTTTQPCSGCWMGGECVGAGEQNPDNLCQVCDPDRAASAWSNNDAATCDDRLFCTDQDHCADGRCTGVARICDDTIECNGASTCDEDAKACTPGVNQCATGTFCDTATGNCVATCAGCLIANICVASGMALAGNTCMVCDPARSGSAYVAATGQSCGSPASECAGQATCNEQGQCVSDNLSNTTACGALAGGTCVNPDRCDGAGNCQNRASTRVEVCGDNVDNDCNELIDDIDFNTDPKNCGACDRSCQGGACSAGRCQPFTLISSRTSPTDLLVDANNVYWIEQSDGGSIMRAPKVQTAGVGPVAVATQQAPTGLGLAGGQLYWGTVSNGIGQIRRAPVTATNTFSNFIDDRSTSFAFNGLFVEGDFVYWGEDGGAFFRSPLTTAEPQFIGTAAPPVTFHGANGSCVYINDGLSGNDSLQKLCVGRSVEPIVDFFGDPFAGRVRNFHAAPTASFVTVENQQVFRLELAPGSNTASTVALPSGLNPGDLTTNAAGTVLYWFGSGSGGSSTCMLSGGINAVQLDGGGITTLTDQLLDPQSCNGSLVVDELALYWADMNRGQIMKYTNRTPF